MADIVQLGYDVDTSKVLKGDQALDKLTASTLSADKATKTLGQSSINAGRSMAVSAKQANNLNRAAVSSSNGLRQVSMQLSQVVQQAQAGGGVLRALAIQLPDIGLAFGTVGIAAGIVGGSLLSVASGFLSASDSADDFEDSLENVGRLSQDLDQTLELLRSNGDELAVTYGLAADRVRAFGLAIAEVQIAQATSSLNELAFGLNEVTGAFQAVLRDTRENIFTSVQLRDALNVTQAELIGIAEAFDAIDKADNTEERQQALQNVLNVLEESNVELNKLPDELQRAIREMLLLSNEADRAAESMRVLAAEAAGVNVGGIGAVPQVGDNNLLPPVAGEDQGGRRGGGRGRVDQYENNLNRLVESLQTERETLEIWYAESEELLNDHRARKLLGEQEHKEALAALDEEYAARQARLADQTAQHEINAKSRATSAIGGLLNVLGSKSKAAAIALIALQKSSSIAQAIQNTAVAQTRALAELGPIAGPPAAAKIAAFGKVQIAAIAATGLLKAASAGGSSGSGSGGGSVAGGVSATSATAFSEPTRRVILDFNGAPDWIEGMFEDITNRIQEGSDTGVIYEVAR